MICERCGMQNRDDNQYCSYCNQSLANTNSYARPSNQPTERQSDFGPSDYGQSNYGQSGYKPGAYGQTGYGQTDYEPPEDFDEADTHVTTLGWIGRFILLCIPVVGFIFLFVWAFGNNPRRSLKTFARANLVLTAISIVLGVIAGAVIVSLGYSMLDIGF
ncbi:MAG: hypothetical protein FWG40_07395 [Peptococcaceae bacterium]|nr:hypothetical protein [Peptococcaceae bacterium]